MKWIGKLKKISEIFYLAHSMFDHFSIAFVNIENEFDENV